jgi:hypothetical protein
MYFPDVFPGCIPQVPGVGIGWVGIGWVGIRFIPLTHVLTNGLALDPCPCSWPVSSLVTHSLTHVLSNILASVLVIYIVNVLSPRTP